MTSVHNVHSRWLPHAPECFGPWLDAVWSGGVDDVFPHDRLVTWRTRVEGQPQRWIPGETQFGHATLRFKLRRWDGTRWEADFLARRLQGWHGFELVSEGGGTTIRHTLAGEASGALRWQWPLAIRPVHDWAIEALFDRLQEALARGSAPAETTRPMDAQARAGYWLGDFLTRGRISGQPGWPRRWRTSAAELRAPLPCDELLVPPDDRWFRAVTVQAPAPEVFRWLCQLRQAPYSYDWLDNGFRRSPRALTPGLDDLAIGQRVMGIFRLAGFAHDDHITIETDDARARRVFGKVVATYAVRAQGPGETRLLVKLLVRYPRSPLGGLVRRVLPLGDLIMMRKQLLTLRALAEAPAAAASPGVGQVGWRRAVTSCSTKGAGRGAPGS